MSMGFVAPRFAIEVSNLNIAGPKHTIEIAQ